MYEHKGFCPCCQRSTTFRSAYDWYRDHLFCEHCDSVVRERALALTLAEILPSWRKLIIHESSPMDRGISRKMREEAPGYSASQFYPGSPLGDIVGQFRNEDLERQTFADASFDLVVTLDVMEHVFDPAQVYREIFRTLRPGGYYLHTFPIRKWQVDAIVRRAERLPDGTVKHLVDKPEYHGNPVDASGSLVTYDYGYDFGRQITEWVPFDVRISRFWDQWHGVIGDYTDVVVCQKPSTK